MLKPNLNKFFLHHLLTATLSVTLATSLICPQKAVAFDAASAIGAIVGIGAQYAYLDKQVNYINNDDKGRNEYLTQIKEKVGVNHDTSRIQTIMGKNLW